MEGYYFGDFKVKSFFEHEISSQTIFTNSECHISEVLTHKVLFERTERSVGEHSYG